MKSRKKRLTEVYVWELPVRIYHWVNALCIVILCITGFIIADPPAILNASEAYFSYWFGVVRFIHFVAAFVFFFNFVFRLYKLPSIKEITVAGSTGSNKGRHPDDKEQTGRKYRP